MAQIFPKQMNNLLPALAVLALLTIILAIFFFWYFGSPKYLEVGYRPTQPVPFSHKLHAGDMGIDCRYCHSQVEESRHANVPPTATCMNCHSQIATDSPKLALVRESWNTGQPINWVRVHKLPDYAYFNHAAHLRAGVGCIECHGNTRTMEEITQVKPLSMSWCLDCHRNPDLHLRPPNEATNMNWKPGSDHAEFVERFKQELKLDPPEDCSACHR